MIYRKYAVNCDIFFFRVKEFRAFFQIRMAIFCYTFSLSLSLSILLFFPSFRLVFCISLLSFPSPCFFLYFFPLFSFRDHLKFLTSFYSPSLSSLIFIPFSFRSSFIFYPLFVSSASPFSFFFFLPFLFRSSYFYLPFIHLFLPILTFPSFRLYSSIFV